MQGFHFICQVIKHRKPDKFTINWKHVKIQIFSFRCVNNKDLWPFLKLNYTQTIWWFEGKKGAHPEDSKIVSRNESSAILNFLFITEEKFDYEQFFLQIMHNRLPLWIFEVKTKFIFLGLNMPKKEMLWEGFYLLVLIAELRDKMEPTFHLTYESEKVSNSRNLIK